MNPLAQDNDEELYAFAQFMYGQMELLRLTILFFNNYYFEQVNPLYCLNQTVKTMTDHKYPTPTIVYSLN